MIHPNPPSACSIQQKKMLQGKWPKIQKTNPSQKFGFGILKFYENLAWILGIVDFALGIWDVGSN